MLKSIKNELKGPKIFKLDVEMLFVPNLRVLAEKSRTFQLEMPDWEKSIYHFGTGGVFVKNGPIRKIFF